MIDKPFSPSCERNREPILTVLRTRFADRRHVLEIGSGTGQHAVHFAAAMPWLVWQCSDRAEHLPGIRQWLAGAALPNTPEPLVLDVATGPWPLSLPPLPPVADEKARLGALPPPPPAGEGWGEGARRFDAVFSANTLHIMGWPEVEAFFAGIDRVLPPPAEPAAPPTATLVVYGPFNYAGRYTSDSNRAFDGWLQARDPRSAIRDIEAVDALARAIGLRLVEDVAMPANNRCLVWVR
jgi:SAM-dependent methyltransferase